MTRNIPYNAGGGPRQVAGTRYHNRRQRHVDIAAGRVRARRGDRGVARCRAVFRSIFRDAAGDQFLPAPAGGRRAQWRLRADLAHAALGRGWRGQRQPVHLAQPVGDAVRDRRHRAGGHRSRAARRTRHRARIRCGPPGHNGLSAAHCRALYSAGGAGGRFGRGSQCRRTRRRRHGQHGDIQCRHGGGGRIGGRHGHSSI